MFKNAIKIVFCVLGMLFIILSEQLNFPLWLMRVFYVAIFTVPLLTTIISKIRRK